jgi:outer membrane lipoprotein-sorting protein
MKRLVLLCNLFFFVSHTGWAQNEAALVKAVRAKLDKVTDYQASGQMKIDVSFIKAPQSVITVYYKKPNNFKVKKSDGISILPKGGVTVNINSLLGTTNYTVVPAGTVTLLGKTLKVVKLLPLDENSDVVLTTLYIDEKEKLIRKSNVTTKENGSYEMELEYGKYAGWGLPDKVVFLFSTKDYKLPKGITFEYEKGEKKKAEPAKVQKGRIEIAYTNYIINKGISDAVFRD